MNSPNDSLGGSLVERLRAIFADGELRTGEDLVTVEEAANEIERLQADAMQWQPITRDQMNGSVFLCWFEQVGAVDAFFTDGMWYSTDMSAFRGEPTRWLPIKPPGRPLEHLVRRLRDAACGYTEWRVQDPVSGAYCIAFDLLSGGRMAAEGWLANHRNRYPGGLRADYVVAEVTALDDRDKLLREAADAIEQLGSELTMLCNVIDGHQVPLPVESQAAFARDALTPNAGG